VNEVHLVGRLSAHVQSRILPSGDELTSFSVIVDRPARDQRGSATVDTINCLTVRPRIGAKVQGLDPGAMVEVWGSVRRRFWRTSTGLGSSTEVEVTRFVRVRP
jgi:single-strand DNA-binding protein